MGAPVYCHPDEVADAESDAAIAPYMDLSRAADRAGALDLPAPAAALGRRRGEDRRHRHRGRRGGRLPRPPLPRPRAGPDRALAGERPGGAGQRRRLPDRLGASWASRCRRARRASPTRPGPGTTPRRRSRSASWRRWSRRWSAPATPSRCAARTCARRWNGRPRSTEPTAAPRRRAAIVSAPDDRDLRLGGADLRRLAAGRARRPRPRRRAASSWSWLEPAVGFGAVLTVTGLLARAPGHGDHGDARPGPAARRSPRRSLRLVGGRARRAGASLLRAGLPVAIVVAARPLDPVRGQRALGAARRRLQQRPRPAPGLGRVAAQRLRAGARSRLPARPARRWRSAVAAVPGIGLGQAFVGEIFAIGILTGADRAGRARGPRRRRAGCSPRRSSPSPTWAPPTSPRAPSRRPPRRSSSSPSPSACRPRPPRARPRRSRLAVGTAGCCVGAAAGAGRRDLLLLQLRRARLAGRDRRALEPDPARGAAGAGAAGAAAHPAPAGDAAAIAVARRPRGRSPWSGPSASSTASTRSPARNTYGPVSPVEALGVWPAANYRLDAAGGAQLTGLAAAIGALARSCSASSGGCAAATSRCRSALGACAVLYLASLPFSGEYSQAKALMIAAPAGDAGRDPPAARRARRRGRTSADMPKVDRRASHRLGWAVLAVAFVAGAVYSSFLVLRDAPVGPPGHGGRAAAPSSRSSTASRCSTPARTATPPTSCWAPTPTCRWSSSPTPTSPRTRKSRSTPATPTARSTSTPSRAAPSTASPT